MRLNTYLKRSLLRKKHDACPVTIPWFKFAFSSDPISRVHRLALGLNRDRPFGIIACKILFYTLVWPIRAGVLSLLATQEVATDRHTTGVSRIRLFAIIWYVMLRHNLSIDSCFRFKIWHSANLKRAHEYIQDRENVLLLPWLSRHEDVHSMDHKILFAEKCNSKSLPSGGIVARVTNKDVMFFEESGLPKSDLFVKFNGQWGGSGGHTWNYEKAVATWTNNLHKLNEIQLLRHLQECAVAGNIIVQRKLDNGPELEKFSSGALCTFRVVTLKVPGRGIQLLHAVLRMPIGNMQVDNFSSGGLVARIKPSGKLTNAIDGSTLYLRHDIHPNTRAQITGTRVICWNDVRHLAIQAHKVLTDVYAIGWDIAWTKNGPHLIEANVCWGEFQMTDCDPLGSEFCEFVLAAKAASEVPLD